MNWRIICLAISGLASITTLLALVAGLAYNTCTQTMLATDHEPAWCRRLP